MSTFAEQIAAMRTALGGDWIEPHVGVDEFGFPFAEWAKGYTHADGRPRSRHAMLGVSDDGFDFFTCGPGKNGESTEFRDHAWDEPGCRSVMAYLRDTTEPPAP